MWGGSSLFIHDVCVRSSHRCRGVGKEFVRRITDAARSARYDTLSLVSVEASVWFWAQYGFLPCADWERQRIPAPDATSNACAWDYRKEYGEGAMLMLTRPLGSCF